MKQLHHDITVQSTQTRAIDSVLNIASHKDDIAWTKPQKIIQDFLREPQSGTESANIPVKNLNYQGSHMMMI